MEQEEYLKFRVYDEDSKEVKYEVIKCSDETYWYYSEYYKKWIEVMYE